MVRVKRARDMAGRVIGGRIPAPAPLSARRGEVGEVACDDPTSHFCPFPLPDRSEGAPKAEAVNVVRSFSLAVTAVAAVMAGAGLFAIAARAMHAAVIHLATGNAASAVIVGVIALCCFLAALIFLMPSLLRRLIQAGEEPRHRPAIRLGAIVVLFTLLIAAKVTDRAAADRILGLVPHAALWPATLGVALLFTLAFILPGFAYSTGAAGASDPSRVPDTPRTESKLAWSVNNLRSPFLRRAVQALGIGYLALIVLAFYAWAFASVLPDPAILAANRKYLMVTILLPTLAMALPIWRAAITGDAKGTRTHLNVKAPIILGLLLFNGLMAVSLPERALPIVANLALGAHDERREVVVVEAKPRSGQRGCGAKIVVLLDRGTGREYDLCHMPRALAEKARPGDRLVLHGLSAGYGLVLERATHFPRRREQAQLPSRQRLTIG